MFRNLEQCKDEVPMQLMKTRGGEEVWFQAFLTSARNGGELTASRSGRFTAEVNRSLGRFHGRSGCSRLENNLFSLQKMEPRILCHAARSCYAV